MGSYFFQFLTAFIIFLEGVQESLSVSPPSVKNIENLNDVKSKPVHFFVTRTSEWSTVGTMPFEKEYLNLGGGMNLANGIFTAPKAGIYAFTFKGSGSATGSDYAGYSAVSLRWNGAYVDEVYSIINGATSAESTVSVHGTLKLNKGDTITISHAGGTIASSSDSNTQFTGSLLEEELVFS